MTIDASGKFLARAVRHGRVGGHRVPSAVGAGGLLRAATDEERAEFALQLLQVLHATQRGELR